MVCICMCRINILINPDMKRRTFLRLMGIPMLIMVLMLGVYGSAYAQNVQKPTIAILATGGTIAGAGESEVSSAYKSGAVTVDKLLVAVPQVKELAVIKGEQVAQIGSQDMNNDVWLKVAKILNELANDPSIDGFVITHGTDTMEETAFFLNLIAKTDKPIVMTGAMRPSTALGADGPRNLYDAVLTASSPLSKGKGVMVVMDDKIYSADDITKTMTTAVETFQCPNFGPLGYVLNGKPWFTREVKVKNTLTSEFSIDKNTMALPEVVIIYGYANENPMLVEAAVKAGVKGIVYAGMGNGNPSTAVEKALAEAVKKGVFVVRTSRVFSGPTIEYGEVDDVKNGFVASWFRNPQKSKVLLTLALMRTNDVAKIQQMFKEY